METNRGASADAPRFVSYSLKEEAFGIRSALPAIPQGTASPTSRGGRRGMRAVEDASLYRNDRTSVGRKKCLPLEGKVAERQRGRMR